MDETRTTEAMAMQARQTRRPAPRSAPLWPAVLAAWIGSAAAPLPASSLLTPDQPAETRPQT